MLGNPAAAISAYDKVGRGAKRDHYVFGALLHQGRDREARELIQTAIETYPEDARRSRLGKLGLDAALLALETGDRQLAERTAAKLGKSDRHRVSQRFRAAHAFADAVVTTLAGGEVSAELFPLGQRSPLYVYLNTRGRPTTEVLATLREHTAEDAIHFSVVSSHIYVALWFERARAALDAGELEQALQSSERVLSPRHYDTSRGVFIRKATRQHALILRKMGRTGQAEALEARMRAQGLASR